MVKIASCQLTPASEIKARKAQINDILLKCETERMDFICFPEGFLTGYYAQENLARKHSLEVGEAAFAEWLELFRISTATIIVGFNEREGSHIFDSAAIVENGKLLGVQRKHYLYHDYFTSGTSFSPFSSKGITFGVVICLDTNYFEPARLLSLQGATILFSPMCNRVALDHPYAKRPPYYSQFVARSHENRCWLITADWVLANDGETICPGHSSIYDPDGREIARSREGNEDILVIDIPKERLFEDKGRRVHGSPSLAQELRNINEIRQTVEQACLQPLKSRSDNKNDRS
ncbi:MAG: carbon-nitrogen hydrolase family protein [Chlamydiia bacterium]